jgi:gamma-glutamyl-gamma-aminobutyrate hydrolase PuuD
MRPLIGITGALRLATKDGVPKSKHSLRTEYTEAIVVAGGVNLYKCANDFGEVLP